MEKENPLQKTFVIELALLKALAIREHYESYINYIDYDKLLEETRVFLDGYKQYYNLYTEHKEIDFDTFLTQFTSNWHSRDMHQEQISFYTQAIIKVKNSPLDDAETALLGLVNKQLIDKLMRIGDKPFTSEQLRAEIETYEVKRAGILREYDPDVCTLYDVDFTQVDKSNGIPYCHEPLQECLGSLVLGSLVLYNAAYGLGKTAEVHEQLAHTLKWKKRVGEDRPVLWINTEGTSSQVWGRQWSNLYQEAIPGGYRDIMKQRDKLMKHFEKHFGANALYVAKGRGKGINYIRMKILKYNPCLVILDMAAQIIGQQGKNVSDTKSLETYFDTLREFSSEYCPIIATVQAGNGAKWWDKDAHRYKYKQWPDSDDIYGSKSAIQGAAETIITIGRDDDHETTRYLRTTKLKEDSVPVKFVCELEKRFSSYKLINTVGTYGGDNK